MKAYPQINAPKPLLEPPTLTYQNAEPRRPGHDSTVQAHVHTLPPARVMDGNLWIMDIPVLSTAHLPQIDFDELPDAGDLFHSPGALLRIDADSAEEWEEAGRPNITRLIKYLDAHGFSYAKLDPDGMIIGDLPVWDW